MITRLKDRQTIAEGTMLFTFERPANFQYEAGQSIDLTLINPPETDAEGNMRAYSLASAPLEPDLKIASRMRDTAFKRVIRELPIGSELSLEGPFGSFTLHRHIAKPAVFLIGGIGITPIHSIVLQAQKSESVPPLYLFYSNRRPEDSAFLEELNKLGQNTPNFHFVPTMTNMKESVVSWSGETGYINKEMIKRYLSTDDIKQAIYYLAGPSVMVKAMRTLLHSLEVDSDNIRTEEFTGY